MLAHLRRSFSDRRVAVIGSLAVLSLFVVAMIAFRFSYTGSSEHSGIAWNLALAWIPFALALVVYERTRSGPYTPALGAIGALWLLFLPNAPYLVTDLKYVGHGDGLPVLYDLVLLTAAAYVLMQELRLRAARTACARTQVTGLRDRLLKLGVQVVRSVRRWW